MALAGHNRKPRKKSPHPPEQRRKHSGDERSADTPPQSPAPEPPSEASTELRISFATYATREFWEECRREFLDLAKDEPNLHTLEGTGPPDDRWVFVGHRNRFDDFKSLAEKCALACGHSSTGDPAVWFWLDLLKQESVKAKSSHYQSMGVIERVLVASVWLCEKLENRWVAENRASVPDARQIRYSKDCRSVQMHGQHFVLTPNQALIIQVLIEHWESKTPDVGAETLLSRIGSITGKVFDSFRTSRKAWTTLICSKRRGTYRLNLPNLP